MTEETTTNPVEADDTRVEGQEGVESQTPELELDENGEPIEAAPPEEDDTEEVEYDGGKYRIPKALKGALLMQADYTRKTQEVAEQRRTIEQERAAVLQEREQLQTIAQERIAEHAKLVSLDNQIAETETIDWDGWEQRIRQAQAEGRLADAQADQLDLQNAWRRAERLKADRQQVAAAVQRKEHELHQQHEQALAAQRVEHARRVQEGYAKLPSLIEGWNSDLELKIAAFARTHGVPQEELTAAVAEPRNIKLLHLAMVGEQALKAQAAAKKVEKQAAVQPEATVRGSAPAKRGVDDRTNIHDWMEAERKRVEAKRKQRR
jgi:hypothetical protein